mgnify:CR=1 FL=1
MSTTTTPTVDLAAVKARQQAAWASGDYARVAARIPVVSELLCDRAGLEAGARVLDVAAGSGNTSIAAARQGCEVVGIDYVPELLARARRRAEAEGLPVELVEADAERLPFADGSFDAVVSVFGAMFAPDQPAAAAELVRVCRPGGTIAMANWTPGGFIGRLFSAITAYLPPPPGLRSPMRWGRPDEVRELLGPGVRVETRERTYTWRSHSAEEFTAFFATHYGPALKALAALEPEAADMLRADMVALADEAGARTGRGSIAIPAGYLEVVATVA